MRNVWLLIIACCFVHAADGQKLTTIADSIRVRDGIPELSYAIIGPTSILELHTSGHHRIDDPNIRTQANTSDFFHLGSNTKAITSFIAAMLVEQNRIKWDTRFFELFPTWLPKANPVFKDITLQQLLSHQAAIPPFTEGKEFAILPTYEGEITEKRLDFVQSILKSRAAGAVGTYRYSNAGYSVAALMLEQVAGKSWESLVTDVLGDGLGMQYRFGWPSARRDTTQPYGHWLIGNRIQVLLPDNPYKISLIEPGTDLSMPITDYSKFVQLHLNGLLGQDNELKASTYKFLHFGQKDYAMGWNNGIIGDKEVSFHKGSAGTFYTYAMIDSTEKRAYVIMMNCSHPLAKEGAAILMSVMMKTKMAD